MFTKPSRKMETLIGASSDFRGELNVLGPLRVDGRVEGKLKAESAIIGETAVVKGEITSTKIIVGGRIEGNLRAQGIVEIKGTGKVLGDIFTSKFSVIEGGEVNGKIEMKTDENKILTFQSQEEG